MPHKLEQSRFELPDVDDWFAGDSRILAFEVVNAAGDVDLTDATVSWAMYPRSYQDDPADAILSDDDSGVEVVTDSRVDTEAGEFEVRLDGDATDGEWGEYYHRPVVEQTDGTTAQWRGRLVLEA